MGYATIQADVDWINDYHGFGVHIGNYRECHSWMECMGL